MVMPLFQEEKITLSYDEGRSHPLAGMQASQHVNRLSRDRTSTQRSRRVLFISRWSVNVSIFQ